MLRSGLLLRLVLGFVVLLSAAPFATAQTAQRNADVSVVSERHTAQAGETFYAAFDMVMKPGWHVYWRNSGDSGLPTVVNWSAEKTGKTSEFVWPAPHELVVLENEIVDYGYSDRVVLPFAVTVPEATGGVVRLTGRLDYLICKDICIPEDAAFDVRIPVGSMPDINEAGGALIAEWIGEAPTVLEGETCLVAGDDAETWTLSLKGDDFAASAEHIRFFPYNHEIKHSAAQVVSQGAFGASITLTPGYDPTLGATLDGVVVVERAGARREAYEISAPICAEAIAGTFSAGGTSGLAGLNEGAGGGINLFAIAGLALLGGLVLNLMPCVLPVLSIKAMGMVSAATSGDTAHLRAHGIWYTLGVVLSFLAIAGIFLALRAAGELVSLGFQLQFPVIVAGLALIMFVIGLWLLGMFELGSSVQNVGGGLASRQGSVGAFFTGVLAAVVGAPCVGPFLAVALGAVISEPAPIVFFVFLLIGLGLALPFLLLSFMPGLQRLLPKPGAWMERLKQFFAFPMFMTAAWLLSVLGEQAGTGAVMWTAIGASLIAFGIWALKAAGGRLKAVGTVFGAVMLLGGIGLPLRASLTGAPASAGATQSYSADYASEPWSTARVEEILGEGRGIFVDFTATWCATCQVNKLTTLKKPSVQQAFAENDIVFMIADFTNRDDEIAAEIQKHKRPGVPMYLYYAPGTATPKVLPQVLSAGLIMDEIELGAH